MQRQWMAVLLLAAALAASPLPGCATAPKVEEQATFVVKTNSAQRWFERNVSGLRSQLDRSAGYIVFPDILQWGVLISGGNTCRGVLYRPDDTQSGWSAVNAGTLGLQAGVQGFKMLIVLQDEATLEKFKANQWQGTVAAVGVVGEAGGSVVAPFTNGTAVYTGASKGVMAGVKLGLEYIRYQPRYDF